MSFGTVEPVHLLHEVRRFSMGEMAMHHGSLRSRIAIASLALCVWALGSTAVQAQVYTLYSDTLQSAATAGNYTVYQTTGAGSVNTASVTFGFDYSTLGIPAAPNNGGSTLGLRVQSDQTANTTSDVIGAVSVVTNSLALPPVYTMRVEVWGNYIGGTTINDANGSNGTTAPTVAVGVKGTTYQSATTNGATQQGGLLTASVRDATAGGGTYRLYINGKNEGNNSPSSFPNGYYAAGDDATAAEYNTADSGGYYSSLFPAVSAPAIQSGAASTQTGTTQPGTFGFAWHLLMIANDGTNTTWALDGTTITTVPDSAYTVGGGQIALGDQDSNTSMSSAGANGMLYNFDVFNDLVITAPVPEPGSMCLLGVAGAGLLFRRWRRRA